MVLCDSDVMLFRGRRGAAPFALVLLRPCSRTYLYNPMKLKELVREKAIPENLQLLSLMV